MANARSSNQTQERGLHIKHYNACRRVLTFMTLHVEWRNGCTSLPASATVVVAFPGVGNIGKVAVESIRELNETTEVARLHVIGLPPHADLDEDGLLSPPHLSLCLSDSTTGSPVLSLTGKTQPNESALQSEAARELLAFFKEHKVETLLVLAGMRAEAERKETFAVACSASFRIDMEALGVDVRRDEPKDGAIGLGSLLASMAPLYNINGACIIGTTVGASGDVLGSKRMVEHLNQWFGYGLNAPTKGDEWLVEKLNAMAPKVREDLVGEMTASHDAFYM